MPIEKPLTEQDLEQMNANLQTLADLDEQVRLAQLAGVDVSDQKARITETRQQILKMKQAYFPGSI